MTEITKATKVIRITREIHKVLRREAFMNGCSIRELAEGILSKGLGIDISEARVGSLSAEKLQIGPKGITKEDIVMSVSEGVIVQTEQVYNSDNDVLDNIELDPEYRPKRVEVKKEEWKPFAPAVKKK